MAKPATSPSTYSRRPHEPHSRRTAEIQSSFRPGSGSLVPASQNAHDRHGAGMSSTLSSVIDSSLRAISDLLEVPDRQVRAVRVIAAVGDDVVFVVTIGQPG